MSEYDSTFVFVPIAHLQESLGIIDPATKIGNVSTIQIKLKPGVDPDMVRDILRDNFRPELYGVYTWRDKQGALLAAVQMERTVLNILLFFIIAVAGFGILAIFFMIVVEKTRDVGILKSLGASSRGILGIFLGYGLSLGIVGAGVGLTIGLLFVSNINQIRDLLEHITGQPVFDPAIYYFYKIPTIIDPFTVFWIMAGALSIGPQDYILWRHCDMSEKMKMVSQRHRSIADSAPSGECGMGNVELMAAGDPPLRTPHAELRTPHSPFPTPHSPFEPSETSAAHLAAVNLKKNYRKGPLDIPVLLGVDLEVQAGEFLAIVGQSGSGKSTLLHLLGTLDAPTSGEVHYHGRRIDNLPAATRERIRNDQIGMIFQFYHLLPELTTLENVLAPLMIGQSAWNYWRQRREFVGRATKLLETVGLGHRLKHRPRELSGGEMQRAAIARALISQPQVLLADEPTGNLDQTTGQEILRILRTLNQEHGLSIVMVTHDSAIADQADRIVRLVNGRVDTAE
jgi:lipoprotein-releasing system ATP-binding protein